MVYVPFKYVINAGQGTTSKYGSAQLLEIMQILNGVVTADKRPEILNEWLWKDHFDMIPPGSAPAAPTDTNSLRIYVDPSNNHLTIKRPGGTTKD